MIDTLDHVHRIEGTRSKMRKDFTSTPFGTPLLFLLHVYRS